MLKIVTDIPTLRKPCEAVTLEEGVELGQLLLGELRRYDAGVGLAANQLGIFKKVCVINVNRPIILINPKIVGSFEKIEYDEGCLSFSGELITTVRYKNVMVKDDSDKRIRAFYGLDRLSLLESICVQHEIDHLNGITMHDRQKGV